MVRIFIALSVLNVLLIGANVGIGFLGGDYNLETDRVRQLQTESRLAKQRPSTDEQAVQETQQRLQLAVESLRPIQRMAALHNVVGLLAALVTILVNSISVTYFIGTGRWCKEVVEAYGFDESFVERSRKLKRRSFPWALAGMTTVILVAALGAASDPATLRSGTSQWVASHLTAALLGTGIIAGALWMQVGFMAKNNELILELVERVHRERSARGLATDTTTSEVTAGE